MKKSKILFPLFTALSTVPAIAVTVSCGDNVAKDIANAIFDPVDSKPASQHTDNFYSVFKGYNDKQRQSEVIYNLFYKFNEPNFRSIGADKTFRALYKDNTVGIKTNITKCQVFGFDDAAKTFTVDFLGYVSFVFAKEYKVNDQVLFKANDYVMITYDLASTTVSIDNNTCSFAYTNKSSETEACLGMIKEMKDSKSALYYIKDVNTSSYNPTNSQNYIK